MRRFLEWGRIYRSELGESTNVLAILPKKLSFTEDLPDAFFENRIQYDHRTVFSEVTVAPFGEIREGEREFFASSVKEISSGKGKNPFNCLVEIIKDVWALDKFHLVMHSSGYESRLISLAIKKIYEKEGKDWLGDVLFLESGLEGKEFREIMQYIGWKEDQYVVYEDGVSNREYHRRSFEFSNAWRRLNGLTTYPVNLWWEPVEWAQKQGLIPGDSLLQCWTGYGMNEIGKVLPDISSYLLQQYYRPLFSVPMRGENWVLPFRSFDYILALVKHGLRASISVLKEVDSCLAYLKRSAFPYRSISNRLLSIAVDDYERSFYGKLHPNVEPTSRICYSKWWGAWCLASFCEYLLNQGYELQ